MSLEPPSARSTASVFANKRPVDLLEKIEDGLCEPTPQRENVDENWQVDLLHQNGDICQNTMEWRVTPAVATTTCSSQWRRDARVLGSLLLQALGSLGPLSFVQYPRWFESTSWSRVAVGPLSLLDACPGSESSPLSLGRFWGPRPLVPSTIARVQEATDPQTPRLLGVSKQWRCFSSRPCCSAAVRSRLFGLPAREI